MKMFLTNNNKTGEKTAEVDKKSRRNRCYYNIKNSIRR
jgi:hypothetical protein